MYFLDILHQIKRSLRHLNLQTPDSRFKIQEDPMSKTAPEPDKKEFDEMPQDILKHILSFLPLSQNLTMISKRILDCLDAMQQLKFSRFNYISVVEGTNGPWIQEVSSESVLHPLRFYDLPYQLDYVPTDSINRLKGDLWFKVHDKKWTSQFRRCDLWTAGHGFSDREYRTGWMKIDAASPETPDQILRDRWIVPKWAVVHLWGKFMDIDPNYGGLSNHMTFNGIWQWNQDMAFHQWKKDAIERATDYN